MLWGDKFEETTAIIFVTEMRKAGLRVKVIGLSPQRLCGAQGLVLVPDLTLEQALPLADNAICLIIPCASSGTSQLRDIPAWPDFCERACVNNARFVVGPLPETEITDLGLGNVFDKLVIYPDKRDLVEFARQVARSLSVIG